MAKVIIGAKVDESVARQLRAEARRRDRTTSWIVAEMLTRKYQLEPEPETVPMAE